ncbi:HepT-like ribonuclease domain-containing protein [Anaeromicropila herbilytica]|uniref:DUF86 domain-containing protein n=1 Tax=Anaeromicropila herbilytica TaxID=2785025 RepID=A0A7R7EMZ4_9FIRM|nr:HepT-like ribonuclease domain-containing protein [Anaeromicropila herbilytica]BCN31830.1 hypothetical protein bsdtb5_31250 [Anaeromicropila herbilytica]
MNEDRLLAVIADMSESIEQLKQCRIILESKEEDETSIFITYGLKQLFVESFITVEDFTSIMLKELKRFKIGIDMRQGLSILLENHIIDERQNDFLNAARLLRNRISHRYKEPSREELMAFVKNQEDSFDEILTVMKRQLIK